MHLLTSRKCRICQQLKSLKDFRENGRKIAKENRCKSCINSENKIRADLKKIAPPKPNKCECCNRITSKLCLDHCHDTLQFRGWICHQCNRGIGQLGDNIAGLEMAMRYLRNNHND
jgi:hypothetical protein